MILEDEGGSQVVRVPMAIGSLLGLSSVIGNKPFSMTAVAKKGAQVGFVARDDVSALMITEPGLALMTLRVLAAEVDSTRKAISDRRTPPHRGRSLKRKRSLLGFSTRIEN